MNKFKKHVVTLCIIILTIPLCPLLVAFCDNYADYTYFVNFISALLIVASTGLWLFKRINGEKYITLLLCDAALIVSANKLYSYKNLINIKDGFNVHSPYMGLVSITMLSIAVLLIIKLILWAKERDMAEGRINNASRASMSGTGNTPSNGTTVTSANNQSPREANSLLYTIAVSVIVILCFIGSIVTIYIFRKPISNGTLVDFIPYILLIIGMAIAAVFLLNILTLAIKSIINLIIYKEKETNLLIRNFAKYRLSVTITIVLFATVYFFRGDYSLDSFINLINDDLGNYLSLPLAFCVLLAAFFVIVLLVQIILKIFSINVDDFPPEKVEEIGKKILHSLYEIAKKLYFIVISTIESIIDFAEFIPDYFETIKVLIMGDDNSSQASPQPNNGPGNNPTTNNTGGGSNG